MANRKNHPGSLDRRGDGYRWRVSLGGQRHLETFPTTEKRTAAKWARERYRELEGKHERRREGLATDVTIEALFDRYVTDKLPRKALGTQRTYLECLKPIREYFNPSLAVEKVRKGHIEGYLAWRAIHREGGGNVGNRTLSKERAVLHSIFAFAGKLELCSGNPVTGSDNPKWDKREPIILDTDQYEKLLTASERHPMLWLHVLTLGEAGLRCDSECLWLRWEDVDLKKGWLNIVSGRNGHRTKAGKSRLVPMTPRLHEAMKAHFADYRLARYGEGVATPWVFHHLITKRLYAAGSRILTLRPSFDNARSRADLPPQFVRHDLRHRRVTTWLAAGKDLVKVQRAMGHSKVEITMGYLHLVPEDLRSLVETKEDLKELAI
ncbi:MAG: tyrosine-type recombinase/integrase [Gemmatimonadetes bacterium]|nr:tyrosine-type recombinase/integrase [Gemmatimonadota bacterium]